MATVNRVTILSLLVLGPHLLAHDVGNDPLATARALRCDFRLMAIGAWNNGAAQAQVKATKLLVEFNSINTDEGTAESVRQFGRSDIIAKLSASALHLIETFRDGPIYMTTVFKKKVIPGN